MYYTRIYTGNGVIFYPIQVHLYWVGLKGLHGFEFPSAASRSPTVCLTAIFGKIGRKSLNHVQAL